MKKKVIIIGCGWLGKACGQFLSHQNYNVLGTTRDANNFKTIQDCGITPVLFDLKPDHIEGDTSTFKGASIAIIAVPPGRNKDSLPEFENKMMQLFACLESNQIKNILFISSTSVYGNSEEVITENTIPKPDKASGHILRRVENILTNHLFFNATILRFGGLIGYDRNPARFLANKSNVDNGDCPVNLIHLDDCVQIIYEIIHQYKWGEQYNACMPEHPTRKDFYQAAAKHYQLIPPTFSDVNSGRKLISSDYLTQSLKYKFRYKSPFDILK